MDANDYVVTVHELANAIECLNHAFGLLGKDEQTKNICKNIGAEIFTIVDIISLINEVITND